MTYVPHTVRLVFVLTVLATLIACGSDDISGAPTEGSGDADVDAGAGDVSVDTAPDVAADVHAADAEDDTPAPDADAADAGAPDADADADTPLDTGDTSPDVTSDVAPDVDAAGDASDGGDASPDVGDAGDDGGRPDGCGDGVRQGDEECDDGNDINDDECSNACRAAVCGDGIMNQTIGVEEFVGPIVENPSGISGHVCDDGATCATSSCEVYDNGNAIEHGICQSLGYQRAVSVVWGDGPGTGVAPMVHAYNWSCFDYDCTASTATNVNPDCGAWEMLFSIACEGIVGEACDDGEGNGFTADACRPDCTLPFCGDGVVDSGEACDDGNEVDVDGCRADCTLPFCGDGIANADEGCDDANLSDTDACLSDCTVPFCGDGRVTAFEATETFEGPEVRNPFGDAGHVCSLGATCPGGTCTLTADADAPEHGICQSLGYLRAVRVTWGGGPGDTDPVMPRATNWSCEDFVCSPSDDDSVEDTCSRGQMLASITCTSPFAEVCDEADANSDAPDATCRTDCTAQRCGDGIVDTGEACDDGNTVPNDACSNLCTLPVCGDGIVQGDEACDDGNDIDTDFCMNACTLPVCGDGVLSVTEDCDEGEENSDEADAVCRTDCTLTGCGDGVTDSDEECDDGNTDNRDECTTRCEWAACGDGYRQRDIGEECDDGNLEVGDGCDDVCLREEGFASGGIVYIGHDYFERSGPTDILIGNAVALGAIGGTARVLGWTEWADRSGSGEVANVNAAVGSRFDELSLSVDLTLAETREDVEAWIDGADVLLMYEAEGGSTSNVSARGEAWSELLTDFVTRGGVIVVTDFSGELWRLLVSAGLMEITSSATISSSGTVSVLDPDDPLMLDMPDAYRPTNGSRAVTLPSDTPATVLVTNSSNQVVVFHLAY